MYRFLIALVLAASSNWVGADNFAQSTTEQDTKNLGPIYRLGDCNFRITNLYGGAFSPRELSGGYTAQRLYDNAVFHLRCYSNASQEMIDNNLYAKKINGGWINLYAETPRPFTKKESFKATNLNGLNWSGVAISSNMTTGPEEMRKRISTFCLVETNGVQVLCGEVQESLMFEKKKGQKLDDTIRVLKTLVFVAPQTGEQLLPLVAPATPASGEPRQ